MSTKIDWDLAKWHWDRMLEEQAYDEEFMETERSAFLVTLAQEGATPEEIRDRFGLIGPDVRRLLSLPEETWKMFWESLKPAELEVFPTKSQNNAMTME